MPPVHSLTLGTTSGAGFSAAAAAGIAGTSAAAIVSTTVSAAMTARVACEAIDMSALHFLRLLMRFGGVPAYELGTKQDALRGSAGITELVQKEIDHVVGDLG